jgi:HlyD family secretion protein
MRALTAQLDRARASLAVAKRDLEVARAEVDRRTYERDLARMELKRSDALIEKGFATRQQYDRDRTALQTAEAALAQSRAQANQALASIAAAKAQVTELAANLADTRIEAPSPGRVLFRLAEPGEVLPSGGKVLTISSISTIST